MIYLDTDDEVKAVISAMLKRYYSNLLSLGVTVGSLFVFKDRDKEENPRGMALEHDGYAAAATIRITKLKERVAGRRDVEILICGPTWTSLGKKQRDALIDHELYHIEVIVDYKTDQPKMDDHGRPALTSRKHDINFGWFVEIAKRHGQHSFEVQQAQQITATYGRELMIE